MAWKIVRKSNFDEEIFLEKFVENLQPMSQGEAEEVAEALNRIIVSDNSPYIYAAVDSNYELYDGYEANY